MSIVTRRSLDILKKINKDRVLRKEIGEAYDPSAEDPTEESDSMLLERLKAGIQNLSREHQMVLRLFYMEQYSMNEISEILSLSAGTVKSRLYHAREKLKTYLK